MVTSLIASFLCHYLVCILPRILPERNVTLMFFRERKDAAEPSAEQGGLCAAQSPPWTLWILDLFKLKREDRIGKVTNFCATSGTLSAASGMIE